MTTFSVDEVENLASMLDKNFGFKRPDTQTVGYSLAENVDSTTTVGAASTGPTPGGIHIPATIVNRTIGLPAPSLSKEAATLQNAKDSMNRPAKPKGNAIWSAEEVSTLDHRGAPAKLAPSSASSSKSGEAAANGKEEPEHEVLYKQSVNAEDVYLGVDFTRDGSSAMSDGIVVKIKLPKAETASDFQLEVKPFILSLTTKDYFLKAHLPSKVVENKAAAKWDGAKKLLQVSLTCDTSDKEVKLVA